MVERSRKDGERMIRGGSLRENLPLVERSGLFRGKAWENTNQTGHSTQPCSTTEGVGPTPASQV